MAPGKGPQPQYLRLPIDSARKLRWYDREDLSRLIESNLQERQQLAEVNTALREVSHHKFLKCLQTPNSITPMHGSCCISTSIVGQAPAQKVKPRLWCNIAKVIGMTGRTSAASLSPTCRSGSSWQKSTPPSVRSAFVEF